MDFPYHLLSLQSNLVCEDCARFATIILAEIGPLLLKCQIPNLTEKQNN